MVCTANDSLAVKSYPSIGLGLLYIARFLVGFEMCKNQEIVVLGQNEADNGVDQTQPEDFELSTTGVA